MDHVAIMKKEWGLVPKILSGEKKLESRWYKNKSKPWNSISIGDTVFFKDSGEPVTVKARVTKVEQYENLNPTRVKELLRKYALDDGLGKDPQRLKFFFDNFCNKRYALFVHLSEVSVVEPFNIDNQVLE